jgi:hypothetical protein
MKVEVDLVARVVTFENLHVLLCHALRCLPVKMDEELFITFHKSSRLCFTMPMAWQT